MIPRLRHAHRKVRLALIIALATFAGAEACTGSHDGSGPSTPPDGSSSTSARPPSCQAAGPGTNNCGSGSEDCCATILVPGGQYARTYAVADGGLVSGLADTAAVSSFRLDKYEVTVGRFRPFVAAVVAGWTPPVGSGKHTHLNGGQGLANVGDAGGYEPGWRSSNGFANTLSGWEGNLSGCTYSTWTTAPGTNENDPINCVNWDEAFAFCIWDDGFLPSEAEWEYAAAGGSDQRMYPWGPTDPGTTTLYAISGCNVQVDGGLCRPAPVGSTPSGVGKWGQFDLAGNVDEWTADFYAGYVDPCTDCVNATTFVGARVMRGGDFFSPTAQLDLVSPVRFSTAEYNRVYGNGVRCARPAP